MLPFQRGRLSKQLGSRGAQARSCSWAIKGPGKQRDELQGPSPYEPEPNCSSRRSLEHLPQQVGSSKKNLLSPKRSPSSLLCSSRSH